MQIKKISVSSLFGMFNHTIPLNVDDGITIIHGPNGYGKSIILRMLDGLFNNRYSVLRQIPFEKFTVGFADGSLVWVEKKPPLLITINFCDSNRTAINSFSLDTNHNNISLSVLDKIIPHLERVTPAKWFYSPTGELLSLLDVLERFGHTLPFEPAQPPDWWLKVQQSIDFLLIKEERLSNIRESNVANRQYQWQQAVEEYSAELQESIKDCLAKSAKLSQSLDRTFPARLVAQMGQGTLTDDALREKLSRLEEQRSRLSEVGILEQEEESLLFPHEFIGHTKDVLEIYVHDMEQKLNVLSDLSRKISLFLAIINKRFLGKQFYFSKDTGFNFVSSVGDHLEKADLSSGEQHELVILYQLLFRTKPNSIVLIDEPETSLH
jgi:predicted ATP-binding protein involved in virulence